MKTEQLVTALTRLGIEASNAGATNASQHAKQAREEIDLFIEAKQLKPLATASKLGRLKNKTVHALHVAGVSRANAMQFANNVGLPDIPGLEVIMNQEASKPSFEASSSGSAPMAKVSMPPMVPGFVYFVCKDNSIVQIARNAIDSFDSTFLMDLVKTEWTDSPEGEGSFNLPKISRRQLLAVKDFAENDTSFAAYSDDDLISIKAAALYLASDDMLSAVVRQLRQREMVLFRSLIAKAWDIPWHAQDELEQLLLNHTSLPNHITINWNELTTTLAISVQNIIYYKKPGDDESYHVLLRAALMQAGFRDINISVSETRHNDPYKEVLVSSKVNCFCQIVSIDTDTA